MDMYHWKICSCYISQTQEQAEQSKLWLIMNSKGVSVLWWEARLYPTWLLLTKGIRAKHPHTSVHYSGEEAAAGFHTAVLRERESEGEGERERCG